MSLEWKSPLDKGVPKEKFRCILVERGLVGGMRPDDIVLPNVSTLMHVFSAILT